MPHIIKVNLSSNQNILDTLDYLFYNYDKVAKISYENSGIQFYDQLTGKLIELEEPIHPRIPNYSELAFYLKVVKEDGSIDKIEKITKIAVEKNSPTSLWMDDEIQMGLSAAFALAYSNKNYISNFITILRTFDLNHEVYETFFIELLLGKWKICDEILLLLAARSGSISGQWGIEGYEIPTLNSPQKNKFITYLLEDTLQSKRVCIDLLLDAMESLDIIIDHKRFKKLFEYHKPPFHKDDIPSFSHIEQNENG